MESIRSIRRCHTIIHAVTLSDIASGAWRAPLYFLDGLRQIYKRFRPLSQLVLTCLVITPLVRILPSNYADKTFFVKYMFSAYYLVCEHAC